MCCPRTISGIAANCRHVLAAVMYAEENRDRAGWAALLRARALGFQQHATGAWTWSFKHEEHGQEARHPTDPLSELLPPLLQQRACMLRVLIVPVSA